MSGIKLKICGMRDPGNMRDVAQRHPDYMGFIFYAASPRYVGDDFVIPSDLPRSIKRVGVFVNESTSEIMKRVETHGLELVQLHGNETPEQCEDLKRRGIKVIKVFSVDDDTDFSGTKDFVDVADYFLFDTKGKYYGGNARAFNWEVLSRYNEKVPFFLSGGISPENASRLRELAQERLHAIDVNSGVEAATALKDGRKVDRIRDILKNVNH